MGKTAVLEHMRGGKFYIMTPAKKVAFLERVDKSLLGLDGLQLVVYSDRCRLNSENVIDKQYDFVALGKKMIKQVNGKLISDTYNLKPGIEFGKKLHQERIEWMKKVMH